MAARDEGKRPAEAAINPMRPEVERLNRAPRCGARTRLGLPCRQAAVRNKRRCRMHGANAGAPLGPANGNWRHGGSTAAAMARRRMDRALMRLAMAEMRALADER